VLNNENNTALISDDPDFNDYKEVMHSYKMIKDKLIEDRKSGKRFAPVDYKADLDNVADQFRQFVVKYPDSPYTPSVLGRMAAVWRILGNFEALSAYMQGVANSPKLQHLRSYALSTLISMHIKMEDYTKAIELSD